MPGRVIFGEGVVSRLPDLVRGLAEGGPQSIVRAVVVVGGSPSRTADLRAKLAGAGIEAALLEVPSEPSVDLARNGVALARGIRAEVVVGIGGGSVIDTAKALAALAANEGDPLDYLEVVGRGQPLTRPSIPVVAVPTTAGSGSEVTKNAVLASTEHAVKVSLRGPTILPRIALVDPELTYGAPPAVTASTGLDAFTQVLEPFVSPHASPFTDALARDGLARAARSLRTAYEHGDDVEARRDMALTSLFGGLALANAKLGAVHGLAGPLGGMVPGPHGVLCARLLPHVMATNVAALASRAPGSPASARYHEVARIVTGDPGATALDGARWVAELCGDLDVRPLRDYGLRQDDIPDVAAKAARSSSMKGNPIELTDGELRDILERAW